MKFLQRVTWFGIPFLFSLFVAVGLFWWQKSARETGTESGNHAADRVFENPLFRMLYWMDGSDYQEVQKEWAQQRTERQRAWEDKLQQSQEDFREKMEEQRERNSLFGTKSLFDE